jgi:uncharacterized membrane protein
MMYKAEASVTISSDPQTAWSYVSDYKNFDKIMSNVRDVKQLDDKTSQWHLSGPLGIPVSWKAVTTTFDAPHKLAWQSVEGSLETTGFITVEPSGAGSKVTVSVNYNPPGGAIGEAFTQIFKDPQDMLEHDLENLGEQVSGHSVEAQNENPDDTRSST